jgi:hemoglobin-like flavoprotein
MNITSETSRASREHGPRLGERQIELIESSFEALAPRGEELVRKFYERLFAEHPAVRPMFSADLREQEKKLLGALVLVVKSLRRPEAAQSALAGLGKSHKARGAVAPHYDAVGGVLLATLADMAGGLWTPETKEAWATAYEWIARTMQEGDGTMESEARRTSTNGNGVSHAPPSTQTAADIPLRALFDSTPVNFIYCDASLTIRYLNRATRETLAGLETGLDVGVDQLVGESIDALHPFSAQERRSIRAGKPVVLEVSLGSETVSLNAAPVRGSGGELQGVSVTFEVVTTRARVADEARRTAHMIDSVPVNLMYCDKDLTIRYMNETSRTTLERLQQHLPVRVDKMVGSSIDVFHKNPSHQRRILADPKNLPHRANITLGPEVLSLLVTAIRDASGNYVGPMLTWEVVTEKVKMAEEERRLRQMIDSAPINVMYCDADLTIKYINETSRKTLGRLQQYLPVPIDKIIGSSVDAFHKNPSHQRGILSDPRHLPHQANIRLGPETLSLSVSAITDASGKYLGPMLTWEVVTEKLENERKVKEASERERVMQEELQRKVDLMLDVVKAASAGDLTKPVPVSGEDAVGQMGAGLAKFLNDFRKSISTIGLNAQTLGASS